MIDQLKKPPSEFEEIIKTSFYVKKDIILKSCNDWLAQTDQPAKYERAQNQTISQEITSKGY